MRKSVFGVISGLGFAFSSVAGATDQLGIGDLEFGQTREQTLGVLEALCDHVDAITATPVQFPLASQSEEHLRCRGLKANYGTIEQSVFLIADSSLAMIEMRGGAINAFVSSRSEEPQSYLHYSILDKGQLFADHKLDAVWLLHEDALHPNLFTWANPFLNADDETRPVYDSSARLPDFMKFGATLDELRPEFEAHCPIMNVEINDRVWLETEPTTQTQVNCFGIEYAGFPRKIEAVFGDSRLELLWILTAKPEEGRVREALVSAFGQPDKVDTDWDIFDDGQIALRKDKPEILAISRELIPHYFETLEAE